MKRLPPMFNYFVLSTYTGSRDKADFARVVRAPIGQDSFSDHAEQYCEGGKWKPLTVAREHHRVSVEGGKQLTPAMALRFMRRIAAAERDL